MAITTEKAVKDFKLPREAAEFLSQKQRLVYNHKECEPGKVTLCSLAALKLRTAWVDPSELPNYSVWNPHRGRSGYYEVPCVPLSATAQGYKPDGILVWIPKCELFATCDIGHGVIWVFPDASWELITAEPARYLGAQWNVDPGIQALLVPWGLFQFREGNPYDGSNMLVA